uniref:Zinc finger CHCC-type domain-containing protein n=1 Tax=Ursus maritimus TaxID=29073 RepID=A0A452UCX0_URSMA
MNVPTLLFHTFDYFRRINSYPRDWYSPGVSRWESFIGGEITQTGRVHDVKNYRKIPVVGHPEEVSENFDIDLATEQLWSAVESQVTACDGGEGALGHGNLYINLNRETKTGAVVCSPPL